MQVASRVAEQLKLRVLGNLEILGKSHNVIEQWPIDQSFFCKMKILSLLAKNC